MPLSLSAPAISGTGRQRSVLELSSSTGYDDAMLRFAPLFRVLPLAVFTGCTSLVTNIGNQIRAVMPKEEINEDTHNYGAFFRSAQSLISELPKEWSGARFTQYAESRGGVQCAIQSPKVPGEDRAAQPGTTLP
jgi:hypothetical protein